MQRLSLPPASLLILQSIYFSIGLWMFSIASFSLFRIFFLVYFQNRLTEGGVDFVIIKILMAGIGQDFIVSSSIVIFYILAINLFLIFKINFFHLSNNIGEFFCAVSSFLYVCSIYYFEEFNSHFNFIIFQLDAFEAKSLAPILWHDYNIFLVLLVLILVVCCSRIFLRCINYNLALHWPTLKSSPKRFTILLAVYLVFLGTPFLVNTAHSANANFKEAGRHFLQKVAQNPFSELVSAFYSFCRSGHASNLKEFLPDNNIYSALNAIYSEEPISDSLDDYMVKTSQGPLITETSHVFFVVMESYSAWPMMSRFESLHLTDKLKEIGSKGVSVKKFLPSGSSSSPSLRSLLTGLYYAYDTTPLDRYYPTAPANVFGSLGYSTRFFYGGELSWNGIGKNAQTLGFHESYGSKDMSPVTRAWKVSDHKLFNFVVNTIEKNAKTPSFNFIFTTSNHPPLTIDLDKEGFPLKKIPENLPITSNTNALTKLGHLWYSDQQLGKFVDVISSRYPDALFVILGDHPSSNPRPLQSSFLESNSVPLVIYRKDSPLGWLQSEQLFGSHMDVLPTMVELIAPKGFTYHASGNNIFNRGPGDIAIGIKSLITSDFIMDMSYPSTIYAIGESDTQSDWPDKQNLRHRFNSANAISWWRSQIGFQVTEKARVGI